MGKRIRIRNKDLADKLGLSGTLVSLVLNNKADQQGISKETQEKVLAMAKQMGYFDSLHEINETSPVEEKPGIIGMIVPSLNDPFVSQVSQHLQIAFSRIGIGFSIISKDPDDQRYDRLISAFKMFFSGLILLGDTADENTLRKLKSTNYPFVLLEKSIKSLRLNTICTDTKEGANLMVDHIYKLGYKNIIIASTKQYYHNKWDAIQHLTNIMIQKAGMRKPEEIELDHLSGTENSDFEHLKKLLRPPYRADVIIIMNAILVYPLMKFLREIKLRVPQDIAVVSMEDGIGFDLLSSPLTCLRKPYAILANKVSNIIWTEVKNSGKSKYKRQINISPELIVRKSCGTI